MAEAVGKAVFLRKSGNFPDLLSACQHLNLSLGILARLALHLTAVAGYNLIAAILPRQGDSRLGCALVLDAGNHRTHFLILLPLKREVLKSVEYVLFDIEDLTSQPCRAFRASFPYPVRKLLSPAFSFSPLSSRP